jgi:hypothetical protein
MMPPSQPDPLVLREKHPTEHGEGRGRLSPQREALLQARIKDLSLRLAGTPLERHIAQLHAELEAKGISFKPRCYLSDEWGCPSGVPVIGLPFYLADPALLSIEADLGGGAESETEILMYLRHEAGHAFNYAYRLYETDEWLRVFGDYSRPYRARLQAPALLAALRAAHLRLVCAEAPGRGLRRDLRRVAHPRQ